MIGLMKWLPAIMGVGLIFATPAHAVNYDCSKAGNANKAACKGAATKPAAKPASTAKSKPAMPRVVATKTATTRHYDCSKAGNANKAACKGKAVAPAVAAAPVAARPAAARSVAATRAPAPKAAVANGPNGATAKCRDGTYSHAAHHTGACSRHGGVQNWY